MSAVRTKKEATSYICDNNIGGIDLDRLEEVGIIKILSSWENGSQFLSPMRINHTVTIQILKETDDPILASSLANHIAGFRINKNKIVKIGW